MNNQMSTVYGEWTEIKMMVKVATLFYVEGLSQREISEAMGLSPSKVSRLLKRARQQRIVSVNIENPLPFEIEEERFLEKTFNLREAVVVPRKTENEQEIIRAVGAAAGDYFLQLVKENTIVALGQGMTLRAVVDRVKSAAVATFPVNVTFVPLVGGLTKASPETHTNFLARELANALGGHHLELYAPQLADSVRNRDAFMSDSSVVYVLSKARAADIMIVGIGDVSETSRLIELCSFTRADMERLNEGGAVGEIGSNFYNSQGQPCCNEYNQRVVGLTLEDLKKAPLVMGVAAGDRKIKAIHGILKGGVLDVLVTDDVVARTIRSLAQQEGCGAQDGNGASSEAQE